MGAMCLPLPVGASPLDQDSSWRSNVEIMQNADPDLEIFVLVLRKKLSWFWIVWSWLFRFFLSPFWHNKAWFRYIWSLFWRKIVLHTGCIVLHCATSCYIVTLLHCVHCVTYRLRWRCTVRSAPSPGFCIANILLKIFWIFCLKYLLCELSCQVSPGQSIERLSPFKPKLRRTVTVSIEAQKEALKCESCNSEAKIKLRREALVTKAGLWPHFSKLWKHSGVGKG